MNNELRMFFEKLLDVINEDTFIPIESKKFVLYYVLQLVEKKADEIILHEQLLAQEKSDKEGEDAESIYKNKLEKLSK